MNISNTTAYHVAFAIPLMFFCIQAFIDKKYLFLIIAAICTVIEINKLTQIKKNNNVTVVGKWFIQDREAQNLISSMCVLWLSYTGLNKLEQISFSAEIFVAFIWILVYMFLCKIIDINVKNILLAIHLKTIVGIILVLVNAEIFDRTVNRPISNAIILASLIVIVITYYIGLKMILSVDKNNRLEVNTVGLYRSSFIILLCVYICAWYKAPSSILALIYNPLSSISVHWICLFSCIIGACIMFFDKDNFAKCCKALNILAVVTYYILADKGYVDCFNIVAVIVACIASELLFRILYRTDRIKNSWSFLIVGFIQIMLMYIIAENIGKGRSTTISIMLITVILIKIALSERFKTKLNKLELIFVTIPYFYLMLVSEKFKLNELVIIVLATIIIIACYLKISYKDQVNQDVTKNIKVRAAVISIVITIPLLLSVYHTAINHKYVDICFALNYGMPTIGNEVDINIHGIDVATVDVDWGNNHIESYTYGSDLITAAQSNFVKVIVVDRQGKKNTFRKFLPIWSFGSNE